MQHRVHRESVIMRTNIHPLGLYLHMVAEQATIFGTSINFKLTFVMNGI